MKAVIGVNAGSWKSVFLFLTLYVVINFIFAGNNADAVEYCLTETFEARCDGAGEVVVMATALYGRMNLGRCLQKPYDTIGCHDDALAVVDAKCSGRRHCRIPIPDKDLHELSSCAHHQLIMYLEATFICLRVFQSIPSKCSSSNAQTLTGNHGHIAHTHSPSYRCSWKIRLSQGLRVNLTLLDFGTSRHLTKPGTGGGSEVRAAVVDCYMYAYVREASVLKTRICSGSERERVVYLSESSSIEVETLPVTTTEKSERNGNPSGGVSDEEDGGGDDDVVRYILRYEAFGCAELPVTSAHMVVLRPEPDRLVISCDNATKPRYLVCRNGEWNGTVPACSQHSTQHEQGFGFWSKITSDWAHAILITVAIGMTLGIIMGVALLAALMTYLKRRDCRQKRAQQQQQQQQQQAQYYSRSVRTATEENNDVQIYYERSRGAFYTDTKAPPVEFMQDSWLLMGHHHQAPSSAEDVACSCPASEGKLLSSPDAHRMTERQVGDNLSAGRKGHPMDTEHVYEMTC